MIARATRRPRRLHPSRPRAMKHPGTALEPLAVPVTPSLLKKGSDRQHEGLGRPRCRSFPRFRLEIQTSLVAESLGRSNGGSFSTGCPVIRSEENRGELFSDRREHDGIAHRRPPPACCLSPARLSSTAIALLLFRAWTWLLSVVPAPPSLMLLHLSLASAQIQGR